MSKKQNKEYPLPEGCMAIQINDADIDLNMQRELITYPRPFHKENMIDEFCVSNTQKTIVSIDAKTYEDVLFLTGKPSEWFPSLNGKDILIIITDSEGE